MMKNETSVMELDALLFRFSFDGGGFDQSVCDVALR